MITNEDLSIPADTPGRVLHLRRKHLPNQALDRTTLQILLIHPKLCAKMINMSKEKKQIWQAVFLLCFQRDRRGHPENFKASEAVCSPRKARFESTTVSPRAFGRAQLLAKIKH